MPLRDTRPGLGRIPTTLFHVEGRRIDAKPSSPIATAPRFALTPAPEPEQGAICVSAAHLAKRHFRQHDGAGLFRVRNASGIQRWNVVFHDDRTERGGETSNVDLVFDQDRDAMKRPDELSGFLELGVEFVGFFESFRIEIDDGIDRWTVLVVGIDAVQVHLCELTSR
jgi:hypothetical protein